MIVGAAAWQQVGSSPPSPVPWTPADLAAAPKIWLDDDSAITEVSGAVSQWNDLSGAAMHLTQTSSSLRPVALAAAINGRRAIRFDGTNDGLEFTSGSQLDMMRNVGAGWCLSVVKKRSADGVATVRTVAWLEGGGTNSLRFAAFVGEGPNPNVPSLAVRRLDADSDAQLRASSGYSSTDWHVTISQMNWSTRAAEIRRDGVSIASNATLTAAAGNTQDTRSTRLRVGAWGVSGAVFPANIDLACLIMGGGSLPSAGEIEKLEGWAAWRYGLQANLPGGHPYESSPPYL